VFIGILKAALLLRRNIFLIPRQSGSGGTLKGIQKINSLKIWREKKIKVKE